MQVTWVCVLRGDTTSNDRRVNDIMTRQGGGRGGTFSFYLKMMLCKSNGYSMIPVVGMRTLSTSC